MEEQILKAILDEIKGVRGESVITNERLNGLTERVDGLNGRVDILNVGVNGLNGRVDTLTKHVDGLHDSVIVLQQGLGDVRYEVHQMKEILAEKVIWQNDSVSIETKEGNVIYGIIHRDVRK